MEALKKFNPGTIVEWCVLRRTGVEQVEFRRVFWAFNHSILGFKHCRPVISIDATHLYGKYKGKLMIAMGVDGNNQILPLAFAIVENESYASWSWFLSHVKKHVVKDTQGICLISDRHAGILKAVNEQGSPWLEPHGFHRYCLRHFINNFNDKFRNSQLKALAYRAGSQNQIRKFNSIMEEIGKINRKAREWLEQHAFDKWTLAHDGGKRYGLLTTNLSEIFNSVLKGARFLPITSCVQLTFYRLVHYFDVRRPMGSNAQANGDMYTPHILAKQAASMSKAGAHSLRSFNRQKGIFEVITQKGKNVQVVDLDKKNLHVR
ncbi:putative MULE transposase domain-containing protein [Helianthus annuus]|nr:putative MULE transposase domain-containing protein [Helianthus annuus]